MMSRSTACALLTIALVAGACSSGPDDAATATTSAPTTTEVTTTTTAAEEDTSVDDTASPDEAGLADLDAAAEFTLGLVNGEPIDEATYDVVFGDEFREQLSFDDFAALLPQITPLAPWTVDQVLVDNETELTRKIDGSDGETSVVLRLVVTGDGPVQIKTLFLAPWVPPAEFASLDDGLAELETSGDLRLVIADVVEGDCVATTDVRADEQMPLGSVFKLYVLAAVVAQVDDGTIAWDQLVEVRDELDSIPSGITQDDPPGTELSVRELAERMISISDNTATDHLIDLVGKDAVIAAMEASGHSDVTRNVPFMTTREFTIVKFGGLADQWLAADTAGREAILVDTASMSMPPVSAIVEITDPVSVEAIEWFASPNDVCRLLVQLAADADALAITTINPGAPDSAERWDVIAYKGGSEPGVLAMAWYLTDADGSVYVVAGAVSNEDALVPDDAIVTFGAVRDLVGE